MAQLCDIYKYTNIINNKIYIGQSKDILCRQKQHLYESKNIRDNSIFHKAIKKYGIKNFNFEIIEECDQNKLNEREIFWIAYYNSLVPNGYNMTPGGNLNGQNNKKKVLQYSLDGIFIAEHESASSAARKLNINLSDLTASCRNISSQCGGFQWKYKEDNRNLENRFVDYIGEKAVEQYDFLGNYIQTFESATSASKELNICLQSITACCRGETRTAEKYQWKYVGDNKKIGIVSNNCKGIVLQYDKKNNLIKTFISINDASNQTGFDRAGISKVVNGQRKTCGGYIWKRLEINGGDYHAAILP